MGIRMPDTVCLGWSSPSCTLRCLDRGAISPISAQTIANNTESANNEAPAAHAGGEAEA